MTRKRVGADTGRWRAGWWKNTAGSVAMTFAVGAPAMLGLVAAGVDYTRMTFAATQLQYAADQAALLGARELAVATMSDDQIASSAQAFVAANAQSLAPYGLSAVTTVDRTSGRVQVNASADLPMTVAQILGTNWQHVARTAVASLLGDAQLCVLTLAGSGPNSFGLANTARVTAPQCSAYANSTDPKGLQATGSSVLISGRTCTVGGYGGNSANYSPMPRTGCPTHIDPLASVVPPTPDLVGCTKSLTIGASTTLSPGTYCGGITINGPSNVTLSPGVYIMNGGNFALTGTSQIHGTNVAIYFNGPTGIFKADAGTTVELTAPKTGALAGFLIYQDGTANPGQNFQISSGQASNLLGTIYLPQGKLTLDSGGKVADASAYTVIVAQTLMVSGSTNLTLNAMYSATDVPAPSRMGRTGASVVLTQ